MNVEPRVRRLEDQLAPGACPRCGDYYVAVGVDAAPVTGCPECGQPPMLVRRVVREADAGERDDEG